MRIRKGSARRNRRGSALILAIIVVTSLSVLSVAFLQGSLRSGAEAGARLDETRADALAEAAFAEALAALSCGYVGSVATIDDPAAFDGGLFWVEATDLGDGHTRLYATAMIGKACVSQEVVAKVDPELATFDVEGVVAQGDIKLWPNVLIDSYDPTAGAYDAQPKKKDGKDEYVGTKGTIVTNGTVSMKPNSKIMGDVIVGPGESMKGVKGDVGGSTSSADEPVTFGLPTLPNLPSLGDLDASGTTLASGIYRYDAVAVSSIKITGPATIVCDSLDITGSGKIDIDASGGAVNFMVLGSFSTVSHDDVNVSTNAPSDLRFFLYDSLTLNQSGSMFGLFYAPKSKFDLAPKTEVFGAIVCDELKASPGCKLHFDEGFISDPISVIGTPQVSRAYWGEAELPDEVQHARGADPFKALGLDRKALRAPSKAWDRTYRPLDDQYNNASVTGQAASSGDVPAVDPAAPTK